MIETLAPGVFVEEIERGPRPIEGVATGTAAFLGETERGPLRPRLVASYAEYSRRFGGAGGAGKDMALAAAGFFENGGRRLFVVRIAKGGAPPPGGAAWRSWTTASWARSASSMRPGSAIPASRRT